MALTLDGTSLMPNYGEHGATTGILGGGLAGLAGGLLAGGLTGRNG